MIGGNRILEEGVERFRSTELPPYEATSLRDLKEELARRKATQP